MSTEIEQESEKETPAVAEHPVDSERIEAIAQTLQEPNVELMIKVAATLGMERVEEVFARTLTVEAGEGLMLPDNSRRRTAGGVFFYLARKTMTKAQRDATYPKPPKQAKTPVFGPARPQPPTLAEAIALLHAVGKIPGEQKGKALMKATVIGRPKQIKKMDTCTLVVLGLKEPPALPRGLPPLPDLSKATVAVFVANKQWARVEAALKADPRDEIIVEGYPVNDPRNQITGLWALSCTSKGLLRAQRRKPAPPPPFPMLPIE